MDEGERWGRIRFASLPWVAEDSLAAMQPGQGREASQGRGLGAGRRVLGSDWAVDRMAVGCLSG